MNEDFEATAIEEMKSALGLTWKQLAPLIPYGDSYEGVSIAGREVEFERNYLWADQPGGDILCEVTVFAGQTRYDHGAKVTRTIRKP
jgi:hypothetical protein